MFARLIGTVTRIPKAVGALYLVLASTPARAMCIETEVVLQEVTVVGCTPALDFTREWVGPWLQDDERQSLAHRILGHPYNSDGFVLAVRATREITVLPEYDGQGYEPGASLDSIRLVITYLIQSDRQIDRQQYLRWFPTDGGSCEQFSEPQDTAFYIYHPCCDTLPSLGVACVANLLVAGSVPEWAESIIDAH